MAEEMGRGLTFEPKLMANQHKLPMAELKARYGMSTTGENSAEAALAEQVRPPDDGRDEWQCVTSICAPGFTDGHGDLHQGRRGRGGPGGRSRSL